MVKTISKEEKLSQSSPITVYSWSLTLLFSLRKLHNLRIKWLKKWHNRSCRQCNYNIVTQVSSHLKWFPSNSHIITWWPRPNSNIWWTAAISGYLLIGTICTWHLWWKLKIPMAGRVRKKLLWRTQKPDSFFLCHSFLSLPPVVLPLTSLDNFSSIIQ